MFPSIFKRNNNSKTKELSQTVESDINIENTVNEAKNNMECQGSNTSMTDTSTNSRSNLFDVKWSFDNRLWDNEESVEVNKGCNGSVWEAVEECKKSMSNNWCSLNQNMKTKWNNTSKSDNTSDESINDKKAKVVISPSISDSAMKLMSSTTKMSIIN